MGKKLIFSDVDGTLVHIADEEKGRCLFETAGGARFESAMQG